MALHRAGTRVGLLDADIYGPSMPTMFGVMGRPTSADGKTIEPLERFGVKLMCIGFLLEDPKAAIVWRGPMLHGALLQFLKDVRWGELDYLILDLPPGTGDVALTLSQKVRRPARSSSPRRKRSRCRTSTSGSRCARRSASRSSASSRTRATSSATAATSDTNCSDEAAARKSPNSPRLRCSGRFRSIQRCASGATRARRSCKRRPGRPSPTAFVEVAERLADRDRARTTCRSSARSPSTEAAARDRCIFRLRAKPDSSGSLTRSYG